ncbi:MAG TPA: hypothetical protein VH416_02785 [Gaiellaceae bacterium]|jgi:hypothetical protein
MTVHLQIGALMALLFGTAAIACVAASDALAKRLTIPKGKERVGWALVLVPLPTAVGMHLLSDAPALLDRISFAGGLLAFVAGGLLLAASDEPGADDDAPADPPWWPGFESDFRAYARAHPPRRRVPR